MTSAAVDDRPPCAVCESAPSEWWEPFEWVDCGPSREPIDRDHIVACDRCVELAATGEMFALEQRVMLALSDGAKPDARAVVAAVWRCRALAAAVEASTLVLAVEP